MEVSILSRALNKAACQGRPFFLLADKRAQSDQATNDPRQLWSEVDSSRPSSSTLFNQPPTYTQNENVLASYSYQQSQRAHSVENNAFVMDPIHFKDPVSDISTVHRNWYLNSAGHLDPTPSNTSISDCGDTSSPCLPVSIDRASVEAIGPFKEAFGARLQPQTQPQTSCFCQTCSMKQSQENTCLCIICKFPTVRADYYAKNFCRYTGCSAKIYDCSDHERGHFGGPGSYRCQEKHCPLAKKAFKRWADLVRHCRVAHCKIAPVYNCDVLGCKYRDRGFTRKDKLASHVKNVHHGIATPIPGKGLRNLQPAV